MPQGHAVVSRGRYYSLSLDFALSTPLQCWQCEFYPFKGLRRRGPRSYDSPSPCEFCIIFQARKYIENALKERKMRCTSEFFDEEDLLDRVSFWQIGLLIIFWNLCIALHFLERALHQIGDCNCSAYPNEALQEAFPKEDV